MAAMVTTALPHLFCGRHGGSSLLASSRQRDSRRCSGGTSLRECLAPVVHSSSEILSVCRRFGFETCVESEVEIVQGDTLPKAMRCVGVGLLASLVTLSANFYSPCPVFGLEVPLEVSQGGSVSEKSVDSNWDAPSRSGDIPDNSPCSDSSSIATSHNETSTLGAVAENVTLPDECTEEVATNLVPKEEPAQEVTNESVVQEAWQVVNENFLVARHKSWSADAWLKEKQEVLKNPIRSRMAAHGAIRTMLSSLNDPYTRFLTPDHFSLLSNYDVTGIGLNIGESATANGDSYLKFLALFWKAQPSLLGQTGYLPLVYNLHGAGVNQGDELLELAGNSVSDKTAFEAASLIQGPKGTKLGGLASDIMSSEELNQIRRGRCGNPQVFEVERQQDVRLSVYYRLEPVQGSKQMSGYIHLKEFNARAKRDILTAMKRMQNAGAASFVLDLRDNPGGLVQAGIEVAKLFLDEGETVIETVGRNASNIRSVLASHSPVTKAPLTILVNDHTASASEIVASALHDNCLAVLVGKRTFGKGLIQAVYELSDGSGVVLTVGKYVTPGQQDIDGAGIEPDYEQLPGPVEGQEKLSECKLLSRNPF